jgi:hypothetical protein
MGVGVGVGVGLGGKLASPPAHQLVSRWYEVGPALPSAYCLVSDSAEAPGAELDTANIMWWIDRSPNVIQATQSNPLFVPVWRVSGSERWLEAGAEIRMNCATALACSGAFHVFWRGTRSAGSKLMIWSGQASGNPAIQWWNDNAVYVIRDDGGFVNNAVTSVAGTHWLHVWRDGANAVKAQAQGGSEVSLGTLSGTLTLDLLLGRPASLQWTDAGVQTLAIAAHNAALSAGSVAKVLTALEAITLAYPVGGG